MDYSILIVDDEEIIHEGLVARMEYLNIQPKFMYHAFSGEEAIDIVKKKKPDIIITDIQMPEMSGIQLIEILRSVNDLVEYIILTGHAEFSYAEQAIQFGVTAYLLKPISNSKLEDAIKEVTTKLDKKREVKHLIFDCNKNKKQQERMEIEKAINDLYFNEQEYDHSKNILKQYICVTGNKILSAVVHIDSRSYSGDYFEYKDIELIRNTVKTAFYEIFEESKWGNKTMVASHANRNQLLVLLGDKAHILTMQFIENKFLKLSNFLWKSMGISITVGISKIRNEICKHSYDEAMEALSNRVIHGNGNIYRFEDIPELKNENFPTSELVMLKRCFERHDIGSIEMVLRDIFDKDRIKNESVTYLRIAALQIFNLAAKYTINPVSMENMNRFIRNIDNIGIFSNVEEMIQVLYQLILESLEKNNTFEVNAKNKIKIAIKYINANYNEDIAIDELAAKYGMSPNYFSSVFKKETSMTAINYIKTIRIQKACELLKKTNKSVMEIAKDIGYEDGQYFFRVFKSVIGKTPLQYRNEEAGMIMK